jgi:hypothetical protein
MEAIELINAYDRKKKEVLRFRNPADLWELIQHCESNHHIWFRANDGMARQCKVNGAVRRWKRDLTRIEIPVKYGMYEYAILTAADIGRVLIPL